MTLAPLALDVGVLRAWIRGEVDARHVWRDGMSTGDACQVAYRVDRSELSETDGAMQLSRRERLGTDAATLWPRMAIDRLRGRTLQQLAELADEEAIALRRFDQHVDRVVAHEKRRPSCRCNPGGVWDFWNEYEMLADLHLWTLRILRRARALEAVAKAAAAK